MSEKNDWKILKHNLPQGYDRLERIENIVGVGTPDVNYCIDGREGWIEMKSPIEKSNPNSKLFTGRNHKLLQTQKNWFLQQKNAGGKGFILIATDKRWLLINGNRWADFINEYNIKELEAVSCWSAMRPVKDWNNLRSRL